MAMPIKGWMLLYETGIEECPMVVIADRCVRRWRRDIRAGLRATVVLDAAKEMGVDAETAERIITLFTTQYNRARKDGHEYIKAKAKEREAAQYRVP